MVKQTTFKILINTRSFFEGFRKVVEAYEAEVGNKVNLDINPFSRSLRNRPASVGIRFGIFDLPIINGLCYQKLHHDGFLTHLN